MGPLPLLMLLTVQLVLFVDSSVAIVTDQLPRDCAPDALLVVPNFRANWFKAVEYCFFLQRTLIVLKSAEDEDQLHRTLNGTDFYGEGVRFWTAGNNLADSNNYHWHTTGTRMQRQFQNDREQRCVSMKFTRPPTDRDEEEDGNVAFPVPLTLNWDTSHCRIEAYFVCE